MPEIEHFKVIVLDLIVAVVDVEMSEGFSDFFKLSFVGNFDVKNWQSI
jgi:hypothetical protein